MFKIKYLIVSIITLMSSNNHIFGEEIVNVYSARHYDTDDVLLKKFTKETGIKINIIEGKSDSLLTRLKQEGDLSPADIFITVDAGRLRKAEEMDLFEPITSEVINKQVPSSMRHPEGLWFGLTKRARVIVVSKERIKDELTLNYEDLANPKWQGRLLIRSSTNIYNQSLVASLIETHGKDATQEWCKKITENLARKPQGGDRDQIRAVAAGEGDIAVVNHYYLARMLEGNKNDQKAASKVRIIFPNQKNRGTHVNISGAGVLKNAPNKKNAIRLIEFLTSREAQQKFASGNQEYPISEGIETTEILKSFGNFKSDKLNVSKLGKNNKEAIKIMDKVSWR